MNVAEDRGTPPLKKRQSSESSGSLTPGRGAQLAINIALESILLVTYRREAVTDTIRYMDSGMSEDKYIDHTNISEIVCTLLMENQEAGGAIGYLTGCYRRLVAKENAVNERVREDLVK
jgi:hypothetical protein